MNTLKNTGSSPFIDYGFMVLFVLVFAVLLWFTITSIDRNNIGGLVDILHIGFTLTCLWATFILIGVWFYDVLKFGYL